MSMIKNALICPESVNEVEFMLQANEYNNRVV